MNLTWQAVIDMNLTWQAVTNVNFTPVRFSEPTGQAGQAGQARLNNSQPSFSFNRLIPFLKGARQRRVKGGWGILRLRHVDEPFGCELRAERLMPSRSGQVLRLSSGQVRLLVI